MSRETWRMSRPGISCENSCKRWFCGCGRSSTANKSRLDRVHESDGADRMKASPPMPAQFDLSKLSVRQFAERFRNEMIPLSNTFSYFCASVPMSEEDLKEYLEEPVAALPPSIAAVLPKISILLVPYLERGNGREKSKSKTPGPEYVSIERPPEGRLSTSTQ